MIRCVDCLGEAAVQVVSPEGVPIATYCAEDWEANRQLGARIMEMFEEARIALEAS